MNETEREDFIKKLAERVAEKVTAAEAGRRDAALASLSADLQRIERRLTYLESHSPREPLSPAPWLNSAAPEKHPSVDRFGVGETNSELMGFFAPEKVCDLEPGGRPCDHCSMCSSRGF